MGTPEQQRAEEAAAMEAERRAFDRREAALHGVNRQFLPAGNGQPSLESLAEFDAAEEEWRAAQKPLAGSNSTRLTSCASALHRHKPQLPTFIDAIPQARACMDDANAELRACFAASG